MSVPDKDPNRVDRVLNQLPEPIVRLFHVDVLQYDRLFTLVLTIYIGILLVMTLEYRPEARQVPWVIGIPTFLMLLTVLAIQSSSRVRELADQLSNTNVFGVGGRAPTEEVADQIELSGDLAENEARRIEARFGLVTSTVAILGLLGLIYVFGFYVSIVVFLVIIYRYRAGLSWLATIAITAAVWLFAIGIFHVVLKVRLYAGLLDIGLGSLL